MNFFGTQNIQLDYKASLQSFLSMHPWNKYIILSLINFSSNNEIIDTRAWYYALTWYTSFQNIIYIRKSILSFGEDKIFFAAFWIAYYTLYYLHISWVNQICMNVCVNLILWCTSHKFLGFQGSTPCLDVFLSFLLFLDGM